MARGTPSGTPTTSAQATTFAKRARAHTFSSERWRPQAMDPLSRRTLVALADRRLRERRQNLTLLSRHKAKQ